MSRSAQSMGKYFFLSRHSAIVRGMGYGFIRYSPTGYPWSPINTCGKVILVRGICPGGGKLNDPASKWRKTLDSVNRPLTLCLPMLRYPQLRVYILHPLLLEGVRRSGICNCKTENWSFVGTWYGAHVLWAPDRWHMFCGHLIRGTCFVGTWYGAHVLWAPDRGHMFCGHLIRGTCFVGT